MNAPQHLRSRRFRCPPVCLAFARGCALATFALLLLPAAARATYNPETGRFLSQDPINELGSMLLRGEYGNSMNLAEESNLYAFVGNDAVNRWDALGLRGSGSSPPASEFVEWGGGPFKTQFACYEGGSIARFSALFRNLVLGQRVKCNIYACQPIGTTPRRPRTVATIAAFANMVELAKQTMLNGCSTKNYHQFEGGCRLLNDAYQKFW